MLKVIKSDQPASWTPESWVEKPAKHLPEYDDFAALGRVTEALSGYAPLVSPASVRRLKRELAEAGAGKALLLQAGDCAESFAEFNAENIQATLRAIRQMAGIMSAAANLPVAKIGRIAGQFAKPRSDEHETRGGITLPAYRGDIVNGMEFTENARRTDPQRMIRAYAQSLTTMEIVGAEDFFTAHEALLLPYEQALTRRDAETGDWYGLSAHFLWVGDRTRQPDGAHVEYLRGIKNPIGIKCGPTLTTGDLLQLLDILNPENEAGRITLISRMGHDKVESGLPPLVRAVQKSGMVVTWACDPMHGNTQISSNGYKTRPFENIVAEVKGFLAVHRAEGTHPGGVHLEMTGQDVTECTGGTVTEATLSHRYHTHCDPRMNAAQGVALAYLIAEDLK
jgi:3-deoxy-7-phosphoheptulonate synthase